MPPSSAFPNGLLPETVPAGAPLVRIHHKDNGPVWFGPKPGLPPAYRFDAPRGEYRVLYAAAALEGAFVETILRRRGRIVSRAYVDDRVWTTVSPTRDLKLAKLHDEGLLWHGTDAGVSSSDDYAEPRRLALALHQAFADLDGIAYRARHDDGKICYAIFDRVRPHELAPGAPCRFRDERDRTEGLMRRYGAVFDTSGPIPPP